ncbi:hypothetical protein LL973_22340 [Xanthomonas campestris pv. nigromaculans]|nr:hypothetical protein [Xanthomonas campestris pv. nigromaculans]
MLRIGIATHGDTRASERTCRMLDPFDCYPSVVARQTLRLQALRMQAQTACTSAATCA